jgi:hypothetical protein
MVLHSHTFQDVFLYMVSIGKCKTKNTNIYFCSLINNFLGDLNLFKLKRKYIMSQKTHKNLARLIKSDAKIIKKHSKINTTKILDELSKFWGYRHFHELNIINQNIVTNSENLSLSDYSKLNKIKNKYSAYVLLKFDYNFSYNESNISKILPLKEMNFKNKNNKVNDINFINKKVCFSFNKIELYELVKHTIMFRRHTDKSIEDCSMLHLYHDAVKNVINIHEEKDIVKSYKRYLNIENLILDSNKLLPNKNKPLNKYLLMIETDLIKKHNKLVKLIHRLFQTDIVNSSFSEELSKYDNVFKYNDIINSNNTTRFTCEGEHYKGIIIDFVYNKLFEVSLSKHKDNNYSAISNHSVGCFLITDLGNNPEQKMLDILTSRKSQLDEINQEALCLVIGLSTSSINEKFINNDINKQRVCYIPNDDGDINNAIKSSLRTDPDIIYILDDVQDKETLKLIISSVESGHQVLLFNDNPDVKNKLVDYFSKDYWNKEHNIMNVL